MLFSHDSFYSDDTVRDRKMSTKILSSWSACTSNTPVLVWPDGCRDLIVRVEPHEPPMIFLTGLDKTAYQICPPAGTIFFGLRLAPGSTALWEKHGPRSSGNLCEMKHCGDFPSSLLQKISTHPELAPELLLDCVDTWFKPSATMTLDFFGSLINPEVPTSIPSKSARTFRRHIGSETGASPQFWMGLRRMRKAASDIIFSTRPLVDIALDNHFSDQAHMTREIRRWLGHTPLQLRKNRQAYEPMLRSPDAFQILMAS